MESSASYPPLPDELLLCCFARISRLYYPTLSLVSKRFRSLISSPELYKARSLLGQTETFLYVCLGLSPFNKSSWFILCEKPDKTLKKPTRFCLVDVPILHSPLVRSSGLVVVGPSIYNIGGSMDDPFSSSVSVLDCGSHTWQEAPSLLFDMWSLSASVNDGKIYVAGIYRDDDDSVKDSFQVFNTKTQTWGHVLIPCINRESNLNPQTVCMDDKFHVVNRMEVVAYDTIEGRWDMVEQRMHEYMGSGCYCIIKNILYAISGTSLVWYDSEKGKWRKLKGLVKLNFFHPFGCLGMIDYGGKMVVLWDYYAPFPRSCGTHKKIIMCAVIALERRKSNEIWGKVEWQEHVLTVPITYEFKKVLAVTL